MHCIRVLYSENEYPLGNMMVKYEPLQIMSNVSKLESTFVIIVSPNGIKRGTVLLWDCLPNHQVNLMPDAVNMASRSRK